MNDDEFLLAYRMTRDSFNKLVDLLKDHDVVKIYNKDKTLNEAKTKEKTTKHLMHFLFFLGTYGSGANNTNSRNRYKQGYGTYKNYQHRCTQAILEVMKNKYMYWPDEAERKQIAIRIKNKYGWPNCIIFNVFLLK